MKSDNINQMITTTVELDFYLVNGTHKFDHIKRLISLVRDYNKRVLLYLCSWWKCESGVVSDDEGEDGLEEEGHESVEPEDQTVTIVANVARNLETVTQKIARNLETATQIIFTCIVKFKYSYVKA